ncbi:DNA-directed RNA polymerase I polypeptide [Aaosphaeria arxii CBS 175.79]|uniref:DNA-directed RNA polymerase subunit n=1 Tax=Aaosphaeria arxii CBS 175.79 TaxID=1450172 RepID=A0A6A5Y8B3_9PLEO|nr:DNA-directed RNA polymerase I polypeptide [Aaosphaeria arxii CBS 175.79]KAF2020804.1 DNA-directed RNA polymerase I polypeptide [Aaosphaeria arxii CBS 175.79]
MPLVGSLLFCKDCGNLLARKPSTTSTIHCHICDASNNNIWPTYVVTQSKPGAFPSSLENKRSAGGIQEIDWAAAADTWPTTSQPCPECNHPEMFFREMQLRSADEGSTVFYRCAKCSHMYKADN